MKVMFKKDIKQQIDHFANKGSGVSLNEIYYPIQFSKHEYFEVVDIQQRPSYYFIIKPDTLYGYNLLIKHTIPYINIKMEIEDDVFEWSE
jgi:hypothetical protein